MTSVKVICFFHIESQSLFFLAGEPLARRREKIKETAVLGLLNVALPTVDIYSDVALFVRFYSAESNPYCDQAYEYAYQYEERNKCYHDAPHASLTIYAPHYAWGTMMLVPFLLNYLICWYVWVTTDKRKTVTWVAALLSFYPQFVAFKIIRQIWSNPKKGLQNDGRSIHQA